jgi:hypothetical protein
MERESLSCQVFYILSPPSPDAVSWIGHSWTARVIWRDTPRSQVRPTQTNETSVPPGRCPRRLLACSDRLDSDMCCTTAFLSSVVSYELFSYTLHLCLQSHPCKSIVPCSQQRKSLGQLTSTKRISLCRENLWARCSCWREYTVGYRSFGIGARELNRPKHFMFLQKVKVLLSCAGNVTGAA